MKFFVVLYCIVMLPSACVAQQKISFNRDVRPILSDRCFHCHGPNEHDRQADLRLDQANNAEDAQVITPGALEDSELWRRITADDDDVMPPSDSKKKPLTDAEKQTIRQWIEQGAKYEDFWAFVQVRQPEPPQLKNDQWSKLPIDQFVMSKLEENDLKPNPTADRRTLIRRLSLDLTGLPPTREEIRGFLEDETDGAYERLVDRILAKSHYGEHMTKYWLDLVRFADTNGIHHDHFRDLTPYRDWVIRSFNDNLPYDQFVKYQIAGDLYREPTRDQLIATGFNRLHLIIDVGTALPEESLSRNVIDRVTAVGTAFMGLTVQCAVCHDHKYDPITAKDFYSLSAFFNNLDAKPETGGRNGYDFKRGLQQPYISLASDEQQAEIDKISVQINQLTKQVKSIEQEIKKQQAEAKKKAEARKKTEAKEKTEAKQEAPAEEKAGVSPDKVALTKSPEDELTDLKKSLKQANQAKQEIEDQVAFAMVMKERPEPRSTFVMVRGEYDNPGEQVDRDTPSFLPAIESAGKSKSRMDLANWFVAPDNPLTARVAVNRFWQQIFGVGVVKTSEDFGAQGDWPSHPELLDYLAASYVESGWDTKALMKQIVMSKTYQQSSAFSPEQIKNDPENRLLSRGSRYRLDSEVIRDQVLATSGLLNTQLFGKSVKPPQPAGLWKAVNMPSSYPYSYQPNSGDQIYRRSVYTFWKRSMPPPQMTILNAPNREACIARRERTNTPLQALLLLNEPEYLKASRRLALNTLKDRSLSPKQYLDIAYETITSQVPDHKESDNLLELFEELKTLYGEKTDLAKQLCDGIELPPDVTESELAAWTMLVSTIYNLDITKTRG